MRTNRNLGGITWMPLSALFCAMVLVYGFAASANAQQGQYLVAAADSGNIATITSALQNTSGMNAQLTQLQANSTTPTVSQLQQYECVIIWSNNQFASPSQFGDNLATYIDGGGHVVVCVFAMGNGYNISGRLQSQNYMPLLPGAYSNSTLSLGNVALPNHPIMQGVSSFSTSNFYAQVQLASGATTVATWTNNYPAVAVQTANTGGCVCLNFFAGYANRTNETMQLIVNAMNWRNGASMAVTATAGTAQQVYADEQGMGNAGISAGTFRVENGAGLPGLLEDIVIKETGTADASAAISEIKVFRDNNANMTYDSADVEIGTGSPFNGADGTSTITVTGNEQQFTSAQGKDYFVVLKLSGNGVPPSTLQFVVEDATPGANTRINGVPTMTTMAGLELLAPEFTFADESSTTSVVTLVGTSDVILHQFTAAYPNGPVSYLTQFDVQFSGTGNESTGFDRVRLMFDADNDGSLDPNVDTEVDTANITMNDETVSFMLTGADSAFMAGDTRRYFVTTDLNFTPGNGATFAAQLLAVGSAPASTIVTGPPLPAAGATAGIEILGNTLICMVNDGGNTAGIDNHSTGATGDGEVLMDFSLFSSNAVWGGTSITFRAAGTGDDSTAYVGLDIYEDDGDGSFDLTTDPAASTGGGVFNADDGTLTMSFIDTVFPGASTRRFFLVSTLAGTARAGETFSVSVESMVTQAPQGGVLLNVPSGAATEFTINPARFDVTFNGPGAANSVNNDVLTAMLIDFSVDTLNEPYQVSEFTFTASGTGDDSTAFSALSLYEDTDGSGAFEFSNDLLATTLTGTAFSADNGTYTAVLADQDMSGPTSNRYFLIASLAGVALAGETFNAALTNVVISAPTGLTASGVPTAASTALIIDTPVVTVRAHGAQIATGLEAGLSTQHELLALQFTASNGGENVNGMTLTTSGSGNWVSDLAASNGVEVYLDSDTSGDFDAASDSLLASLGGVNGSLPISFTSPVVLANGGSALVFVVINVLPTAGQSVPETVHTFQASIALTSDVSVQNVGTRVLFGTPTPSSANLSVVQWSVESFTPLRSVLLTGGNDIVITGGGFTQPVSLTIGGVPALGFGVVNAEGTEITGFTVPEGQAPNLTNLEIVLTTGALGNRTLGYTFNYGPASGSGGGGGGCAVSEDSDSSTVIWAMLAVSLICVLIGRARRNRA